MYAYRENPANFTCQPVATTEQLAAVMEQVKDYVNSGNTLTPLACSNLKPGQPILAQYPEDQEWYRAEVMEWNETTQTTKLRYVDYGNDAEVPLSITQHILEPLIISLPKQAIPCRLSGVEPQGGEEGGEWGEGGGALEKLEELALQLW